jgi:hypothetical protein
MAPIALIMARRMSISGRRQTVLVDSAVLFDRYIHEVRGDGSAGLANSALIERNDETPPVLA